MAGLIGFCLLPATPSAAADLSQQFLVSAPIYLFLDRVGDAYALELPSANDRTLVRHYVTAAEFAALNQLGATIAYLPEHANAAIGPCTSADFPRSFNIAFVEGAVFGNIAKCDPDARPSWAKSQAIEFVLFTSGYRGQAAHTVVMPWFKNALHGHGIYFGDTSAIPCLNGQDATFNTRIEGWSQWSGFGLPLNPYWTSTGPFEIETCGMPLFDGWTPGSGVVTAAFRLRVRATAEQWVRYEVQRWDGLAWVVHSAPFVRDMDYSHWRNGPGVFDASANGLLVASTGPLGPSSGQSWFIGVRELSATWLDGWESAPSSSAVEFYHAGLDHYFMTADASEILDLDQSRHAGWTRTGWSFAVGAPSVPHAEPVCRFYGLPSAGLDSHFYSANSGECEQVQTRLGGAWLLESASVFTVDLPDTATGQCPPRTRPVYRFWNARRDSNHRYTTDMSLRQTMLAAGYIAEGYGSDGAVFCSPLP